MKTAEIREIEIANCPTTRIRRQYDPAFTCLETSFQYRKSFETGNDKSWIESCQ